MQSDERRLEAQFQQAMLQIYDSAKRLKPPYNPTAFRSMVGEHGGRETANRLLGGSNPSSGFTELLLRGPENLKLSVEYLVLQAPWSSLFTRSQLDEARRRLVAVGCPLPPEVDGPESNPVAQGEGFESDRLREGAPQEARVTTYERSPEARARCIAHHGTACVVCGFDFGRQYGPTAEGFTHVHHLTPLGVLRQEHEVDPVRDLRPVCANCHAVIHMDGGCRTIKEVKAMIASSDHRQQR